MAVLDWEPGAVFGVTLGKPKVPREGTLEVAGGTPLLGGESTIAAPASLVSCLLLSPTPRSLLCCQSHFLKAHSHAF